MVEKRASLVLRLESVLREGVYTLQQISAECKIPVSELRSFLDGKGYLYTRELDRLRHCLPKYEQKGRRRSEG